MSPPRVSRLIWLARSSCLVSSRPVSSRLVLSWPMLALAQRPASGGVRRRAEQARGARERQVALVATGRARKCSLGQAEAPEAAQRPMCSSGGGGTNLRSDVTAQPAGRQPKRARKLAPVGGGGKSGIVLATINNSNQTSSAAPIRLGSSSGSSSGSSGSTWSSNWARKTSRWLMGTSDAVDGSSRVWPTRNNTDGQ